MIKYSCKIRYHATQNGPEQKLGKAEVTFDPIPGHPPRLWIKWQLVDVSGVPDYIYRNIGKQVRAHARAWRDSKEKRYCIYWNENTGIETEWKNISI